MSKKLGTLEIVCEAPPYEVVQACAAFGFNRPEDVRWTLVDPGIGSDPQPLFRLQRGQCRCGEALPLLERFSFSFHPAEQMSCYLGQCESCEAMYWSEG